MTVHEQLLELLRHWISVRCYLALANFPQRMLAHVMQLPKTIALNVTEFYEATFNITCRSRQPKRIFLTRMQHHIYNNFDQYLSFQSTCHSKSYNALSFGKNIWQEKWLKPFSMFLHTAQTAIKLYVLWPPELLRSRMAQGCHWCNKCGESRNLSLRLSLIICKHAKLKCKSRPIEIELERW